MTPSPPAAAAATVTPAPPPAAALTQPAHIERRAADTIALSGSWTALGIGELEEQFDALTGQPGQVAVDGAGIAALDTVGVWMVERLLRRLRGAGATPEMRGWDPRHAQLLALVAEHSVHVSKPSPQPQALERVGRGTVAAWSQAYALLSFMGETTLAVVSNLAHPSRLRWRTILHNIQSAGFNALPIVGLLSFLLGIVVAYQAADQLRRFGANIFVVDLVGLSMLREFAPLMTAIIIAGRSGSAYTAQIGTMAVTEEIDAMRTVGISPLDVLVLPKIFALLIALPLLTVYADVLGVLGGMLMARTQLGIGYAEFFDRFVNAVDTTSYVIGIGKAPVFAAIIAVIGCFQGFRTHGGADAVGRQTTRSVVQAIFLVIVADALFSIWFGMLEL